MHQIAKHLPRFRALHPRVTLELSAPGPVESVDENFDISILTQTRRPLEGNFVARRLARSEVILCAAPEYLDRYGRPDHPKALETHQNMVPPFLRELTLQRGPWASDDTAAESITLVPQRSGLSTAHTDTLYAAALAGLGITGLPSFVAEDALLEHALERVLPDWHLMTMTLFAGMPTRKHVPARTRVFIDFLLATFGGEDHDPWLMAAGCETRPHGAERRATTAASTAAPTKSAELPV